MAWTPDRAYLSGLEFMSGVVSQVGSTDWAQPSPCAGWQALDVVGHVGQAVRFGTALLSGPQPAFVAPIDPPGLAVEGDPGAWWLALVGPARQAVSGVDLDRVVDSPAGPRPIGEGLSFPALDLFVHAWDIGRSAGISVTIPDEAIEYGHTVLEPIPAARLRSPAIFGPEVASAAGADSSEIFLAWTGRDPRWAAQR